MEESFRLAAYITNSVQRGRRYLKKKYSKYLCLAITWKIIPLTIQGCLYVKRSAKDVVYARSHNKLASDGIVLWPEVEQKQSQLSFSLTRQKLIEQESTISKSFSISKSDWKSSLLCSTYIKKETQGTDPKNKNLALENSHNVLQICETLKSTDQIYERNRKGKQ